MLDSTNSVSFPRQLETFFTEHYNEDASDLKNFFKENGSVLQNFIQWSAEHDSTVQHIPRIYKALEIAKTMDKGGKDEDTIWVRLAKSANDVYHSYLNATSNPDVFSMIINPDQATRQDEMYSLYMMHPGYYIEQIAEFFVTGLIDKQQLLNALLVTSPRTGTFALANKEVLKQAYPLLELMDKADVAGLLLAEDQDGESLIESISVSNLRHDPKAYLHLLSILHEAGKAPVGDNVMYAAAHYSNILSAADLIYLLPSGVFKIDSNTAEWAVGKICEGASYGTLDSNGIQDFLDFSEKDAVLFNRLKDSPELEFLQSKLDR